MSEHREGVPFDAEDPQEAALWEALGDIPETRPSPELRRSFYDELERASRPARSTRVAQWLGFSGTNGWLTAAATLLLGIVVGQSLAPRGGDNGLTLEALELQVATLNRNLILDRLDSESPGKRLRGVIDAIGIVGDDPELTRALVETATDDRVYAVRAAAIDALAPQLATPAVGEALMRQLVATESPLVQLALADLLLRHGSRAQIERLLELAEAGMLHADIAGHVLSSVSRNRA